MDKRGLEKLAAREAAVVQILDEWPWAHGGVIIGGYAIAAYGAPRYSHDVDFVVPVKGLNPILEWLTNRGFHAEDLPDDLEQNYAGRIARLGLDGVTLDILPGVVRDREALVDIPETWITRDPQRKRFVLLHGSTKTAVPIVRPEAFWALKIQAGRPKDLADLYSMRKHPLQVAEVRDLFQNLWCETLSTKLQAVVNKLGDEKVFRDSVARSGGSPRDPLHQREWEAFTAKVKRTIPPRSGFQ